MLVLGHTAAVVGESVSLPKGKLDGSCGPSVIKEQAGNIWVVAHPAERRHSDGLALAPHVKEHHQTKCQRSPIVVRVQSAGGRPFQGHRHWQAATARRRQEPSRRLRPVNVGSGDCVHADIIGPLDGSRHGAHFTQDCTWRGPFSRCRGCRRLWPLAPHGRLQGRG